MTDKFTKGFKDRIKPRVDYVKGNGEVVKEPFRDAQLALTRGQFATREREEFFNEAFTDILTELFSQWVKSEPHCTKEREFLYHTALALGSVKENLIKRETLGKNSAYIQRPQEAEENDTDE
jgi:hypothetical protein